MATTSDNTAAEKIDAEKVAIVTGANAGIGFETTLTLARAGWRVVMACRNADKAERARASVLRRAPSAALDILIIDLADFASVRAFANSFRQRHNRLDLLINNAGIMSYVSRTTEDGIDHQFATNHLGHFLLTALLIDLMLDDPVSRVVALSSIAHKGARLHFEDWTCGGDPRAAYGQSKLACLMFADELARRLDDAKRRITALTAHPGVSDSGLFAEMPRGRYAFLKAVSPIIAHSNLSAAQPTLHAALSPNVAGGDYYGPTGLMEARGPVGRARRDPAANDPAAAARLWQASEELTGQRFTL